MCVHVHAVFAEPACVPKALYFWVPPPAVHVNIHNKEQRTISPTIPLRGAGVQKGQSDRGDDNQTPGSVKQMHSKKELWDGASRDPWISADWCRKCTNCVHHKIHHPCDTHNKGISEFKTLELCLVRSDITSRRLREDEAGRWELRMSVHSSEIYEPLKWL